VKRVKSKLSKLSSDLKKLEKKRYSTEKIRQYHLREKKKAIESQDFKDYKQHEEKWIFHNRILEGIRQEIIVKKTEIKTEEARIKEEEYKEKLRVFDTTMITKLQGLQRQLNRLATKFEMSDILESTTEVCNWFDNNSGRIRKEDRSPYIKMDMGGLKITVGVILERYGESLVITATRGASVAAGLKEKIVFFSSHVSSRIEACLKIVKARSKKEVKTSWVKNLKKKLTIVF